MARNRLATELLIVHCSATPPDMDIGLEEIHTWHVKRGIFSERGRTGYHFVIRRDGSVEIGRELRETGAHCLGYNDESIGICMAGGVKRQGGELVPEDNFAISQHMGLRALIEFAKYLWPTIIVGGHYQFAKRACPSFDINAWMRGTFGYDDEAEVLKYIERGEGDGY
jgi:hypothetical protein